MKKLSVLLVALAVAVSASAGINQKVARSIHNNKIVKTEKVKINELKGKATKAKFGVINTQPEGELKSYNRAGQGVYASSGYLYCAQQTGSRMDIVWGENGKVYLKDILFNFGAGTWVEGTYDADASMITVPLEQSIYFSTEYNADINLCWGHTYETEDGKIGFERDLNVEEAVYLVDEAAGTITLLNSEGPETLDGSDINSYLGLGLSAYWTDDDSWYGNLEWNTVLTEREPFVTPDVITEQPEGELYTYVRSGACIYSSLFGIGMTEQSGKMRVVIDDQNNAYIQNPMYWHDYNETWVKGTFDPATGIITVPTGQYLSWYDDYEYGIQMMWGYTYVYSDYDQDGEEGYYLGYGVDDSTTEIQFLIEGEKLILLNSEGDMNAEFPENYNAMGLYSIYSDDGSWGGACEFNTEGQLLVLTPAVPANPTADSWYDNGDESGYSRFYFTLPTVDVDGNPLDNESISYSVYTDNDEIFVFDANTYYYDIDEDMTEIPYSIYSGGYDFSNYVVYFYRTNEGDNPLFQDRIGIQAHYTVNGVKNSSDIIYLEVLPPVPAVPENPGDLTWSDCGDESGYSRFGFTLPSVDIDGNPLDPKKISYSIFTDNDQIFTFDAETYSTDLYEDMTEIPYSIYSNGWDFYEGAVYFYRTNEGQNGEEPFFKHQIGIQVYYTVDGVRNESDIVYLEVYPDTKVNELNAGKTVANVRYFNVAGQEIAEPSGMTIKVTTYTDGTTSTVKVVK